MFSVCVRVSSTGSGGGLLMFSRSTEENYASVCDTYLLLSQMFALVYELCVYTCVDQLLCVSLSKRILFSYVTRVCTYTLLYQTFLTVMFKRCVSLAHLIVP